MQTRQCTIPEVNKTPEQIQADKLGLTPERLNEISVYTKLLRKKFPHMKPNRLQRKVAEHFKLKLV